MANEPSDKLDSDTPSTDAIAMGFFPGGWMNMSEASAHYNMMLDHARQLERQLAEAKRIASVGVPIVPHATLPVRFVTSQAPDERVTKLAGRLLDGHDRFISLIGDALAEDIVALLNLTASHVSPSELEHAAYDVYLWLESPEVKRVFEDMGRLANTHPHLAKPVPLKFSAWASRVLARFRKAVEDATKSARPFGKEKP